MSNPQSGSTKTGATPHAQLQVETGGLRVRQGEAGRLIRSDSASGEPEGDPRDPRRPARKSAATQNHGPGCGANVLLRPGVDTRVHQDPGRGSRGVRRRQSCPAEHQLLRDQGRG